MAPRGEETEVSKLSGALDWDWIKGLDPKTMEEDDFQKLIPLVTEFIPNEQEELNNLISLFRVTAAALKSRDEVFIQKSITTVIWGWDPPTHPQR